MYILIIGITAVISLIALYSGKDMSKLIFYPYDIKRRKRWFQFISSGFIHADWGHLFFNMLTLFFFANVVEEALGSFGFLFIYLGSMILAHIPDYLRRRDNQNFSSLGASGAVSGILFASILFSPTASIMIFPIPIPLPAPIFGVLYLIYCTIGNRMGKDNINHSAHFWGSIAGVLLAIMIEPGVLPFFFEQILG